LDCNQLRRGGDAIHVSLNTQLADQISAGEDTVVGIDAALESLQKFDEQLVRVVEMRYFARMTENEVADALGVTDRTVRRDWEKARMMLTAWLR
jgi:RNA polymerase sigma factor (sigma-70 family)